MGKKKKRIKYPPLSQKGGLRLEKASHSNLIPTIVQSNTKIPHLLCIPLYFGFFLLLIL